MQTEIATLKELWNKAATPGAKARLLAGFSEEVRSELCRQTGHSGLLEGLAEPNGAASSTEAVSGPLQLYILGQLEVKTLEQRVAKARRKAAKRVHKQAVQRLAKEWSKRKQSSLDFCSNCVIVDNIYMS
jgi:hypothetical protein